MKKAGLKIRETGNSVLIGLLNFPPSERAYYEKEMSLVLEEWTRQAKIIKSETHQVWNNPKHYYQTCGFVCFNSWNLITLTLVNKQGLAARMAYIGNSLGHHFYHANDLSIVFEHKLGSQNSKLINVLKRFKITYCYEGDPPKTGSADLPIFFDGRKHIYAETYPFDLTYIYSGQNYAREDWLEKKDEFEQDLNIAKWNVNGVSTQPDELLGVFQIKFNPNLAIAEPYYSRLFNYLSVLLQLNEGLEDLEKDPDVQLPSFIRPLYADVFYDTVIIVRGYDYSVMERLIRRVKLLNYENTLELFDKYGIDISDLFKGQTNKAPIVNIGYSIDAIPSVKFTDFHDRMDAYLRSRHDPADCKSSNYPDCLENCLNDFLDINRDAFSLYKGGSVTPSSLVSIQLGMLASVTRKLKVWEDIVTVSLGVDPPMGLSKGVTPPDASLSLINGRYDLELFPENRTYQLDVFFKMYCLLKLILTRGCCSVDSRWDTLTLEQRQLVSPLLQIKSKFSFTNLDTLPDTNGIFDLKAFLPHPGSVRIITPDLIRSLVNEVKNGFDSTFGIPAVVNPANIRQYNDIQQYDIDKLRFNIQKSYDYFYSQILDPESFQTCYYGFLKQRFSKSITSETIESLSNTLCALDGLLTNPLTYHFFLDLRQYAIQFVSLLFSSFSRLAKEDLSLSDVESKVELVFWNPQTGKIEYCESKHKQFKGCEGWVIQFIELLQKVIGQRQTGIYPNHDRNFSRLQDTRLFQAKKIISVSWMTQELCNAVFSTLQEVISGEIDDYGRLEIEEFQTSEQNADDIADLVSNKEVDMEEQKALLRELNQDCPRYLPYFSNNPEMIIQSWDQSISINSRQLTSIENISLLVHEVGHLVAESFSERAPGIGNGYFSGLLLRELAKKTGFAPNDTSQKQILEDTEVNIWDEILADLLMYKICYAPLASVYDGRLNPGGVYGFFNHQRVPLTNWNPNELVFDQADDFILSFLFQMLQFPVHLRPKAVCHLMVRLVVELGLIKYGANTERYSGMKFEDIAKDIWIKKVLPFLKVKLVDFLWSFIGQNDADSGWQRRDVFWRLVLKILDPRYVDQNIDLQFDTIDRIDVFVNSELEKLFNYYFYRYLWGVRDGEPFSYYIRYLCRPDAIQTERIDGFASDLILENLTNIYAFRQGMTPGDWQRSSFKSHFSAAFQLSGLTNLFYVAGSDIDIVFTEGYAGCKDHNDQQALSRVRRVISSLMWERSQNCIKEELGKI